VEVWYRRQREREREREREGEVMRGREELNKRGEEDRKRSCAS